MVSENFNYTYKDQKQGTKNIKQQQKKKNSERNRKEERESKKDEKNSAHSKSYQK